MNETPSNPHPRPKLTYNFLTLNFSCNDNELFENFFNNYSKKNIHLSHIHKYFYSIEKDETPNKHLHAVFLCPNQDRPDNYKRSFLTAFNKYMKDKYHTSKASIAIDLQTISDTDTVKQKIEYIFKDLTSIKRYKSIDDNALEHCKNYWINKEVKPSEFINIPIIALTSQTILRHVIDYYIKNIDRYNQKNIEYIYVDMIKDNYSFISCSKYVKEQTMYELMIRYFKIDKNISKNNIYDTDNKYSFYTESLYKSILDIFMEGLITDEQKEIIANSENKDIMEYMAYFI